MCYLIVGGHSINKVLQPPCEEWSSHCVRPYLFLKQVQMLGAGNHASSTCVDWRVIDRVTGDRRQVDAATTPKRSVSGRAAAEWKSSRTLSTVHPRRRRSTKYAEATANDLQQQSYTTWASASISRQTRWMECEQKLFGMMINLVICGKPAEHKHQCHITAAEQRQPWRGSDPSRHSLCEDE